MLAGVDEAGRGPLAGPVAAAAVILHPERPIARLDDSKKLSPSLRQQLAKEIRQRALAWSVAFAASWEVDEYNILQASLLAMHRAVDGLLLPPKKVLVDGNRLPSWSYDGEAVVGGDAIVPAISAASILAKVARDREMTALAAVYPQYGFQNHSGYPTPAHRRALANYGPCPIHRRSFRTVRDAPVQAVLFS